MQADELLAIVTQELEERKAENIITIDVIGKTSFTDYMVIASGTSDRHIKALCNYVTQALKEQGIAPRGIEGAQGSEWMLMDLGDVILHVMTAQTREFYQLEKLWSVENQQDDEVLSYDE
ncbi:ribosome-associated protein [Bathymodiolus japonicus methanotrophic gill symbiont]|uniref:ribosome silencing factor n=1 Tax=Bathymodiolus japonicus methanotrophic gill symbiont TaxID=113269 RepID=UPI001B49F69A|nr:ribosome silencing factor [Bathymodiolus japonicus methanotrophic gill symbiont]GFO71140.1 ribosome-associated protein [Bathymodiolus japonicus methanotrophic gill symbiont]